MAVVRPVVGYEGSYSVSDEGDVWSLRNTNLTDRRTPHKLKRTIDGAGYVRAMLSYGKVHRVHRLVAEAFLPNPEGHPMVHHKDEDRGNPCVDNLEWCTYQSNAESAHSKTYCFIDPLGNKVTLYNLLKFCRDNSLSAPSMTRVNGGYRGQHKGWRRYVSG